MILRLALSIAWRLTVAVALVANPFVPVAKAASHAVATAETAGMPCHGDMVRGDSPAPMAMPHKGKSVDPQCPDHCCPGSKCDMSNCMAHCVVFAHSMVPGAIWLAGATRLPKALAKAIPAPPPGERLRPPIA